MNPTPPFKAQLNLSHLRDFAIEYGEGWGYPHILRVLRLVDEIAAGQPYNENVILYAVYLHDWGAFAHFRQPGMDHVLRSIQLAKTEILPYTVLSEQDRQSVLTAISLHDYRDTRPAVEWESLLLREADMLDLLGTLGVLREFAWGPNDLKTCFMRAHAHRELIAGRFILPRAQAIAEERLNRMDRLFTEMDEESFGIL